MSQVDIDVHNPDVTFEEVAVGTKRGGRKLISRDGYSYTVKVNISFKYNASTVEPIWKIHGRLTQIWDEYEDRERTTTQLLRDVSRITGLGPASTSSQNYED